MAKPQPKPQRPVTPAEPEKVSPDNAPVRLAVTLLPDGGIDFDGMRESTREKLRATLPSLNREFHATGAAPTAPTMPPEITAALTHAINQIDYLIVARVTKAPREVLDKVVPFTEQERETINPLVGRVLDKYGTASLLGKYQDECALALVLVTLTQQKIQGVMLLQRQAESTRPHVVDVRPLYKTEGTAAKDPSEEHAE